MTRTDGLRDLLAELRKHQGSGSSDTTETYKTSPKPNSDVSGSTTTRNQRSGTPPPSTKPTNGEEKLAAPRASGSSALNRPQNQKLNPSLAKFRRGALVADTPDPDEDETGHISGNLALVPQVDSEPEPAKPLQLHSLIEQWPDFINHLEEHSPISHTVVLAFRQLQPADVNHGEVLIPCHNSFTLRMLEEHNRELSRELRSYFRRPLNLRSELREPDKKQEINDPYARFKQLQEKDPAIRLIVDLFGAELEY